MASGSAGSIFVDLLLRDAQYREGLKRSKSATSDFAKGVRELALQLAPLLGGAGIAAIATNALGAADAISKAAQTVNLSVEAFQKYSYALKLGGIDQETFTTAIIKLNNNIAEGKLPYASTASAIQGISDKLKNAKDGIERARIASEAFGAKLGARLIPALGDGSETLRKLGHEAENLGLVFNSKLVKDAEKFKDQIEILGEVFTKNFQAGLLAGFVNDSGEIRDIYTDPQFIEGVKALGEAFGAVAQAGLSLAKLPGILRAIVIELPFKAGQGTGNFIKTGDVKGLQDQAPPHISMGDARDIIVNAKLKAEQDLNDELERQQQLQEDIAVAAAAHAKAINDSVKGISDQVELLAIENDHWGENKNNVQAIVDLRKIELDLAEKGVKLSEADKKNIKEKLHALAGEKNLQQELKDADEARVKAQKALLDEQEKERQHLEDSVTRVKEDLAKSLTDVIKGASSLADAFKNVAANIAEAVTQAQILKLLSGVGIGKDSSDGFGSLFSGGGIFEGLLSSFDVGTPFVPRDQIAKVHAGEMIIPRMQAERIRQGGGGGITVNQYISTPDANSFQRSQNQILAQTQQQLARATRRNN